MTDPSDQKFLEFALTLMHSRQNVLPRHLEEPGPAAQQLQDILGAAAAAPDHRQLLPWRFVVVPARQRARLADVFGQALLDRDPNATAEQIERAREKAHRAPFLMLAVVRLKEHPAPPPASNAQAGAAHEGDVGAAERLVSLGCAIQNVVLAAHAAGFGTGLTSGQALDSGCLRALFSLTEYEQAVCCINIGSVSKHKPRRLRPTVADYVSELA